MSDASRRTLTQTPRPRPGLYTLHTDGGIVAAPGQPSGEAAIGAALKNSSNLLVEAVSRPIGRVKDHHIAEFRAFIEGLLMAERPRGRQNSDLHRLGTCGEKRSR